MRRAVLLAAILALLLCGCRNYSELNELALVAGAAVDLTEEGEVLLTLETADFPEGNEPGAKSALLSGQGADLASAIRDAEKRTGRKLYWDQASVLILDRRFAERGVGELLEYILNEHGLRLTIQLAVSGARTAAELLGSETHGAPLSSYALCGMIRRGSEAGETVSTDAGQAIDRLLEPGIEIVLPELCTVPGGEKPSAALSGCALFCGDRQVGRLDREETLFLSMLTDTLEKTTLSVRADEDAASLETGNWHAALRPYMGEEGLVIEARVSADWRLLSSGGRELTLPRDEKRLNEALVRRAEAGADALFSKLRGLSCDALGALCRLWKLDPAAYLSCPDTGAAFQNASLRLVCDFHRDDHPAEGDILKPGRTPEEEK